MKKLTTVLFDLDGTLLPINMQEFETVYFSLLTDAFKDIASPKEFMTQIGGAITAMVKNTEPRTNEEVFMTTLKNTVQEKFPLYEETFAHFYNHGFDGLRRAVQDTPAMRKATEILKTKGYDLVIATNPLFPRVAIEKRITWAGVKRSHFSYVTSFEENHYCKPNLEYYSEILETLGKSPEECLMVGNDALEDLAAGKLGLKTYLITDHLLNRHQVPIEADYVGSYDDFLQFAQTLPSLN